MLTNKTVSYLNPDENLSQFQRSRSFVDGLEQASEAFRAHFKITARGMGRSRWADSPETLALVRGARISSSSFTSFCLAWRIVQHIC